MPNYKSSSVFHYTQDFEQIKNILRYGFKPCYCIEKYPRTNFSDTGTCDFIGIPMVCFCDIPLSCVDKHSGRYGKFAIALSKEWAVKNHLNPLLYTYNTSLIGNIFRLKHDSADKSNIFSCWYNNDVARHELLGYTKIAEELVGNAKKEYYQENEWRYILKPKVQSASVYSMSNNTYKWLYDEEAKSLMGKDFSIRRGYKKYLQGSYLRFEISDIKHIVVPTETDVVLCCNALKRLQSVCGKPVTREQRTLLYSKITSIERIEKDF